MLRPIEHFRQSASAISELVSRQLLGDGSVLISGLALSSNNVEAGDLFIALPGEKFHGADFADEAISRGAVAVLTDHQGAIKLKSVPIIISPTPRRDAGVISAWFYGEPMREMYCVGVTGTNGKTTVSTLLHQIMMSSRRESGLIGTVEIKIGSDVLASKRTTPESVELQGLAAVMRERHMRNLVMEVSSHAIALERVRGSHFSVVAFTNLSQDHLDFHKNMEDYYQTKAKLFTYEFADLAVINIDDEFGKRLAQETELPVLSLSRLNHNANWYFEKIENNYECAQVLIRGSAGILIEGKVNLQGGFNFDNLLMAVAIAAESGIDPMTISDSLQCLQPASGRLEPIRLGQDFMALVDYAHSPAAVTKVLEAVREISTERVIAVLGCGGDRDSTKRALMGKALYEGSDVAIFTSDNPRSENPENILEEMTFGLEISKPNSIIVDRAMAIKTAINQAQSGDLVIILGKGHETGQEIAGVVHPFDDRIELARAIEDRK